jgi:pimeloyl-ACP methyl ester carboxylesterase
MIRHSSALAADSVMCGLINVLQARHRLNDQARSEMEHYVASCEGLTIQDYYAHIEVEDQPPAPNGLSMSWRSPLPTPFEANNIVHVDLFPCAKGWSAPTVLMLHALMSASRVGYRRWAAHFNSLGWNACFVHLPYHYSRVPPGFFNGELAITANLKRNAEGLRQGVMELRQLIGALRAQGCSEFGVLGTSYGAWIGALLACVEPDLRFAALMAPIVNVEHAIWQSPAAFYMRRELRRAKIEPALVARHFHLSSPSHNLPVCGAERVLFVAGEFDLIARAEDIKQLHQRWQGSELLVIPQGHFGYRMMRDTVNRLQQSGRL